MTKKKTEDVKEPVEKSEEVVDNNEQSDAENEEESPDSDSSEEKKGQSKTVEDELAEMKDKYLRLYSEFENFRRRTAKERLDLIQTSTEDLMTQLLPVLDDYERAFEQMEKAEDVKSVKEGIVLIHDKFRKILTAKGLKEMESSIGKEFDAELHEAITQAPAPSDDLKGKIMDEVEKGYKLHEKIIRFAKVVIGQ